MTEEEVKVHPPSAKKPRQQLNFSGVSQFGVSPDDQLPPDESPAPRRLRVRHKRDDKMVDETIPISPRKRINYSSGAKQPLRVSGAVVIARVVKGFVAAKRRVPAVRNIRLGLSEIVDVDIVKPIETAVPLLASAERRARCKNASVQTLAMDNDNGTQKREAAVQTVVFAGQVAGSVPKRPAGREIAVQTLAIENPVPKHPIGKELGVQTLEIMSQVPKRPSGRDVAVQTLAIENPVPKRPAEAQAAVQPVIPMPIPNHSQLKEAAIQTFQIKTSEKAIQTDDLEVMSPEGPPKSRLPVLVREKGPQDNGEVLEDERTQFSEEKDPDVLDDPGKETGMKRQSVLARIFNSARKRHINFNPEKDRNYYQRSKTSRDDVKTFEEEQTHYIQSSLSHGNGLEDDYVYNSDRSLSAPITTSGELDYKQLIKERAIIRWRAAKDFEDKMIALREERQHKFEKQRQKQEKEFRKHQAERAREFASETEKRARMYRQGIVKKNYHTRKPVNEQSKEKARKKLDRQRQDELKAMENHIAMSTSLMNAELIQMGLGDV